ncbi:uncharacterized protein V6R79_017444 [Siganus canaliculatus]
MSSDFCSRDEPVERGPIPLDIDNVHMLLQVEQEQIQKKTFTNWVNAQLAKRVPPCMVADLFNDFRDGSRLLDLLEVMSGQRISRERGRGMFQHRSNIEKALSFLKKKSIKLVNINIPDIIDGKPSIILGLIWTIILQYHIEELANSLSFSSRQSSMESLASLDSRSTLSSRSTSSSPVPPRGSPLHNRFRVSAKKALLLWVREQCHKAGCTLNVKDFKASWRSGVVFLAILYALRPDLVDLSKARTRSNKQNLEEAFRIAERELRIPRLLDPDDVDVRDPDEKSIMTYVAQFLQYSRDLPVPDEEMQTQHLTLPKTPSPINLPVHYTPAISASPLRQATPDRKVKEVTCWLVQAYDELLEGWDSTEGESYSERYHVFHTFLVSFNEQRRPIMPLLTAMRRTPKLSEEQRALREAWDALTEKLREYRVELDASLPAPLDTVARWLLKAEGALAEEQGDPQDHGRAADDAREKQELLKVCLEEMPRHLKTFQSFQNLDEYGNMMVPSDKMDELKRRFTSVRVSAKYHGIRLEYREHRHTVLDLLGQIKAKLRVWKRPYISPEAVRLLLQEWHEVVNSQELPSMLESTLHKLKQVSERYASKSALAGDYQHVSEQVKQLEQDTTAALKEVTTTKSTMGRVLSAWDSYSDCLSSLQAWLEQGSVHGHGPEVTSESVAEWGSRQAHLNEVGNFLIESTDPQTRSSLADELRRVNMRWADFVKRNTFDGVAETSADVDAQPQDIQTLIREATILLKEPVEVMAGPLRTYRKRIQFIMRRIKELDLEALAPSPECPADQLNKLKLAVPEVTQTLMEAEQVCAELQHSVSGLDSRLAELLHWETEARELYHLLKAAERQQRGQDPQARVLISRGLQLEGQVVTEEQDLQVTVITSQKNSPIQYLRASAIQDRVRVAVAQSQEAVGMLSSLGARRDRSRSPPEGPPPPKVFIHSEGSGHPVEAEPRPSTRPPETRSAPDQAHGTFVPKIVVQEYREEKVASPTSYTYAQAVMQTRTVSPPEGQAQGLSETSAQIQQQTREQGFVVEQQLLQRQTGIEQELKEQRQQEVQRQQVPTSAQPQKPDQPMKKEQQVEQQHREMHQYQVQQQVITHIQVESETGQILEHHEQTSTQQTPFRKSPLSFQELQSRKSQAMKNRPWLQKPGSGEQKAAAAGSGPVDPQLKTAEAGAKVTEQLQPQRIEQQKHTQQQREEEKHLEVQHQEKQQQEKPKGARPKSKTATVTQTQTKVEKQSQVQTMDHSESVSTVQVQVQSTVVTSTTGSQKSLQIMSQHQEQEVSKDQSPAPPQPHVPIKSQVQSQSLPGVPAGPRPLMQPEGPGHIPAVVQAQARAQIRPSSPMQGPVQGQTQQPVPSHIQIPRHPQSWAPVRPPSPKPPMEGQSSPQSPVHPQSMAQTQVHPQSMAQTQVHPQSMAKSQIHPQSITQSPVHPQSMPHSQIHPQSMAQSPVHPQSMSQSQIHPQSMAQSQIHPQSMAQSQIHPQAMPQSQIHPQSMAHSPIHPQSMTQSQIRPQSMPYSQIHAQSMAKSPVHPQAMPQSQIHPQSMAPPQTHAQTVSQAHAHPQQKIQAQAHSQRMAQPQNLPQSMTQPHTHPQSMAQVQFHSKSTVQAQTQAHSSVQPMGHSQPLNQYPSLGQQGHIAQGQIHSWTQVRSSSSMSTMHPQVAVQPSVYPQGYPQSPSPSQWAANQEAQSRGIAQQRHPLPQSYPPRMGQTAQTESHSTVTLPQWPQAATQLGPQMSLHGYSQMGPSYTQAQIHAQAQGQPWAQTPAQVGPQSSMQQQSQIRAHEVIRVQTQQGQFQQQAWGQAPLHIQPQPQPQHQGQSQQYSQFQHQHPAQRPAQPQMQAHIPPQLQQPQQVHPQLPPQPQIQPPLQAQPLVRAKTHAQEPQFSPQLQQPNSQQQNQAQFTPQPKVQSPTQLKEKLHPQPKPLAPQTEVLSQTQSKTEPSLEPQMQHQPVVQSTVKMESIPLPKLQMQTTRHPEGQPSTQPKVQSPTQPKALPLPEPKTSSPQPQYQPQAQVTPQSQPRAQLPLQPQPPAQSPLQSQPQAQMTPQPQPQAQSPLQPPPQAQVTPQSQPQPQTQSPLPPTPQAQSPPQARLQTQPLPQPAQPPLQPQIVLLSQVNVRPQSWAESPDSCSTPPALAQVPPQAYTEAYAKAQALARNGFEEAKHCLQEHIMEAINIFEDRRISAEQASMKEEALRTLDPELLEEFLRAAKGMEAFCTPQELTDMEFYTCSVRTQWEACVSEDGSLAQAGLHLQALRELCNTLSPEDAHRLAQTQLRECETRLAAIQRQFSGDQDAALPESRIPVAVSEDLTSQKEVPKPSEKPQVTAEVQQEAVKPSGSEKKEADKQPSTDDDPSKKDVLDRYENSKRTLQTQLSKNEQSISEIPSDSVSLKGLHTRLQEIQFLRQETESLWSDFASQCSQLSSNGGLEQEKTELQEQWRSQQSSLQRRGSSLGAALRQIDSTENHMVDFTDRLDRYLRQPKDVTAFTLANSNILKDIKELDDNIQSELDQVSRLDPESSDLDPRDCFPLSREVESHRSSLDQLRQQVRKSEAAARALDRFLMSLRTVDEDISGVQNAPCSDSQVLQDCRSKLASIRQSIDSLKEKAPQLDVLLQGARLTVTRDGAPASCLDMVAVLLRRLEEADGGLASQQKAVHSQTQSKSLGLRKRTLLGELRKLQETIEAQGLKEPTVPAVQHRLRALSDLEAPLQTQQAELHDLRELQEKQGGGEELFEELEAQWKDTQRAFCESKKQSSVLLELLKKSQSCRGHLSSTLQRAEQVVSDQASYMGKDNLQRSIAKVGDIKEELSGLGEQMEEMRTVCRQLQSQLKKFPDCSETSFEAEADTLMDTWLDVTEKTDAYTDNLQVALELWEKQLMLGGEVDNWAGAKLALFAESHPFHNEQQVLDMKDEIQAHEENIEHFHKKSTEIQEMLQSQEAPLELQVMESQLRKRMQQVKELFTDCTDVFEELIAVKTHLAEKIEECQAAVENIQTSLSKVEASQPKAEAHIQDLCDDLDAQEDQAEAVLKEVGLVSSVASPQVVEALSVDCGRLREAISRTKDMIRLKREEKDQGLLKVIGDEKQSFQRWFQDLQLCVNECFENPESRTDVETFVQRLSSFLKAKDAERRLEQLRDQLERGDGQVPPQQLSEFNDWLKEQQGEVETFRNHCLNRQEQMEELLRDLSSLQKQHDSFRDWLQVKEKQSVESQKVQTLLQDLRDASGRVCALSGALASVRRRGIRAETLLKDGDNLIQRYRNLEERLQKQVDAQSALDGEVDQFQSQAESTRSWISELLQPLSSAGAATASEETALKAQVILSSRPEGDSKLSHLRRQSQTLCEQEDLQEARKRGIQESIRETEEQWRAALQVAEEVVDKARTQVLMDEDWDAFRAQKDAVHFWIRDQELKLQSPQGSLDEEKPQIAQATLRSRADGDSKLQGLRQQGQKLCGHQSLNESRRMEVQETLRRMEEQWRKVLQEAQDSLDQAENQAVAQRDLDAFRGQTEKFQSWNREQKQKLTSLSAQMPFDERMKVVQEVLTSRSEGESKVLDLRRQIEGLEETRRAEVQQLLKDSEQQWTSVLQAARQAELRALCDDFDTQSKNAQSWIRERHQDLQALGIHIPPEERNLTAQTVLSSRPEGDCRVNNLRRRGQSVCDHVDSDQGRRVHVQQTVRDTEEQWRTVLQAANQTATAAGAELTQRTERRKSELREFDSRQQDAGRWLSDLQRRVDSLSSHSAAEDRRLSAQAVVSSKPEGESKLQDLRSRCQSLSSQDLDEQQKQEMEQKVRDAEEQWSRILQEAKGVLEEAERQHALEVQLRDFRAQSENTRVWLQEKQQSLDDPDAGTDLEGKINAAQTVLSLKPEGDSRLSELKRQSLSLSDRRDLEEALRKEAQQTVQDSEERWRTVLQSAEDSLKEAELQYSLSRELEAFSVQAETTQTWILELKRQAEAKGSGCRGSRAQLEDRLKAAQVVLSSRSSGEAQLTALQRRAQTLSEQEHLDGDKKVEIQQKVGDTEQQWKTLQKTAKETQRQLQTVVERLVSCEDQRGQTESRLSDLQKQTSILPRVFPWPGLGERRQAVEQARTLLDQTTALAPVLSDVRSQATELFEITQDQVWSGPSWAAKEESIPTLLKELTEALAELEQGILTERRCTQLVEQHGAAQDWLREQVKGLGAPPADKQGLHNAANTLKALLQTVDREQREMKELDSARDSLLSLCTAGGRDALTLEVGHLHDLCSTSEQEARQRLAACEAQLGELDSQLARRAQGLKDRAAALKWELRSLDQALSYSEPQNNITQLQQHWHSLQNCGKSLEDLGVKVQDLYQEVKAAPASEELPAEIITLVESLRQQHDGLKSRLSEHQGTCSTNAARCLTECLHALQEWKNSKTPESKSSLQVTSAEGDKLHLSLQEALSHRQFLSDCLMPAVFEKLEREGSETLKEADIRKASLTKSLKELDEKSKPKQPDVLQGNMEDKKTSVVAPPRKNKRSPEKKQQQKDIPVTDKPVDEEMSLSVFLQTEAKTLELTEAVVVKDPQCVQSITVEETPVESASSEKPTPVPGRRKSRTTAPSAEQTQTTVEPEIVQTTTEQTKVKENRVSPPKRKSKGSKVSVEQAAKDVVETPGSQTEAVVLDVSQTSTTAPARLTKTGLEVSKESLSSCVEPKDLTQEPENDLPNSEAVEQKSKVLPPRRKSKNGDLKLTDNGQPKTRDEPEGPVSSLSVNVQNKSGVIEETKVVPTRRKSRNGSTASETVTVVRPSDTDGQKSSTPNVVPGQPQRTAVEQENGETKRMSEVRATKDVTETTKGRSRKQSVEKAEVAVKESELAQSRRKSADESQKPKESPEAAVVDKGNLTPATRRSKGQKLTSAPPDTEPTKTKEEPDKQKTSSAPKVAAETTQTSVAEKGNLTPATRRSKGLKPAPELPAPELSQTKDEPETPKTVSSTKVSIETTETSSAEKGDLTPTARKSKAPKPELTQTHEESENQKTSSTPEVVTEITKAVVLGEGKSKGPKPSVEPAASELNQTSKEPETPKASSENGNLTPTTRKSKGLKPELTQTQEESDNQKTSSTPEVVTEMTKTVVVDEGNLTPSTRRSKELKPALELPAPELSQTKDEPETPKTVSSTKVSIETTETSSAEKGDLTPTARKSKAPKPELTQTQEESDNQKTSSTPEVVSEMTKAAVVDEGNLTPTTRRSKGPKPSAEPAANELSQTKKEPETAKTSSSTKVIIETTETVVVDEGNLTPTTKGSKDQKLAPEPTQSKKESDSQKTSSAPEAKTETVSGKGKLSPTKRKSKGLKPTPELPAMDLPQTKEQLETQQQPSAPEKVTEMMEITVEQLSPTKTPEAEGAVMEDTMVAGTRTKLRTVKMSTVPEKDLEHETGVEKIGTEQKKVKFSAASGPDDPDLNEENKAEVREPKDGSEKTQTQPPPSKEPADSPSLAEYIDNLCKSTDSVQKRYLVLDLPEVGFTQAYQVKSNQAETGFTRPDSTAAVSEINPPEVSPMMRSETVQERPGKIREESEKVSPHEAQDKDFVVKIEPEVRILQLDIQTESVDGAGTSFQGEPVPEKEAEVKMAAVEARDTRTEQDESSKPSPASKTRSSDDTGATVVEISFSEQDLTELRPTEAEIGLFKITPERSSQDRTVIPKSLDGSSSSLEKIHMGHEVRILQLDIPAGLERGEKPSASGPRDPLTDVQQQRKAEGVVETDVPPEKASTGKAAKVQEDPENVPQRDSALLRYSSSESLQPHVTEFIEINIYEQDAVRSGQAEAKAEPDSAEAQLEKTGVETRKVQVQVVSTKRLENVTERDSMHRDGRTEYVELSQTLSLLEPSRTTQQEKAKDVKDLSEEQTRMSAPESEEKPGKKDEISQMERATRIQSEAVRGSKDVADVQQDRSAVTMEVQGSGSESLSEPNGTPEHQRVPALHQLVPTETTTTAGAVMPQGVDAPQKSSPQLVWGEVLEVPEGSTIGNLFTEIQLCAETGPSRQINEGEPSEESPEALVSSTCDLDSCLSRVGSRILSCKNHPAELSLTVVTRQLEEAQECRDTAEAQVSRLSELRSAEAENSDALELLEDQWSTAVQDAAAVVQSKELQLQLVTDYCRQIQATKTTLKRLTAELDALRLSPDSSSSKELERLCSLQRKMEEKRTVFGELLVIYSKLNPLLSRSERAHAQTQQKNLQEQFRGLERSVETTSFHTEVCSRETSSLLSAISSLREGLDSVCRDLEAQSPDAQWNCKKAKELMEANAEVKAAQQKQLHLQQVSEQLLLSSHWDPETREIQQELQKAKDQLGHAEGLVSSLTQTSSNPIMEKMMAVMRDGLAWAKQTDAVIDCRRKRVALLPEDVHRQLRDLKKLQSEVLAKQGQLESLVEEASELLPQLDQAEEVPVVCSSLESLQELSKRTTEKLAKSVREVESGLQTREKLSAQIADLDSWVVAHLHREASRSPDEELRSPAELDRRLRQIQETLTEAEKQAAVCEALLMTSKDVSCELDISESCQLFNKLSNLQEDIQAIRASETANRKELDQLTQTAESCKTSLASIEARLRQMLVELNKHRYPITRESLQALEPFKHMMLEHKSQVDLLQPWIPQDKTGELYSVITELHSKMSTLQMKSRDHERYLCMRQCVEDLRENMEDQVHRTKEDGKDLEDKYKLCQSLLAQFPLIRYLSEETESKLHSISVDLFPSQLNAEQRRLKQNVESFDALEMKLRNNLVLIERNVLKELDLDLEAKAAKFFLWRTQQDLRRVPLLQPTEAAVKHEYLRTATLKTAVESRMRALEVLEQRKGFRLQTLMPFKNQVLSECDSRMENLSQARESLRSYTSAVGRAAQFLRDIEASLLPPQGSSGPCPQRLEDTQRSLSSLLQDFQSHMEQLQSQSALHPSLCPEKVQQLQESVMSRLVVRMSTLQAKGQVRLEGLNRCAENSVKFSKAQDDITVRAKSAESSLLQLNRHKISSLSDCTEQLAKLQTLSEEVQSLQRCQDELKEWCPEQSCCGLREAAMTASWRRVSRLRRCTQELMTRSDQRVAEWSDVTDRVEEASAVLEQVEAELPVSLGLKASTEELHDSLQSWEQYHDRLDCEHRALSALELRAARLLAVPAHLEQAPPTPLCQRLQAMQARYDSVKQRSAEGLDATRTELEVREKLREELHGIQVWMEAADGALAEMEQSGSNQQLQEVHSQLCTQKALLQRIMETLKMKYSDMYSLVPVDIEGQMKEVKQSLHRVEAKVAEVVEKSGPVHKLEAKLSEIQAGLGSVQRRLEQRSPDVIQAKVTQRLVWDELDVWHSCLAALEGDVQDLEKPQEALALTERLVEVQQLHSQLAKQAEQRTTIISKIRSWLQQHQEMINSSTSWMSEAQTWLAAPCSYTTAKCLSSHVQALQTVLDDSTQIRTTLQGFGSVLVEMSQVCDISALQEQLAEADRRVAEVQESFRVPLSQLEHAAAEVEAIESEVRRMENDVVEIKALLSSPETFPSPREKSLKDIEQRIQSMRRTVAEIQRCKPGLCLPDKAEETLTVFTVVDQLQTLLLELEKKVPALFIQQPPTPVQDKTLSELQLLQTEDVELGQIRIAHVEADVLKKHGAALLTVEQSSPEQRKSWTPESSQETVVVPETSTGQSSASQDVEVPSDTTGSSSSEALPERRATVRAQALSDSMVNKASVVKVSKSDAGAEQKCVVS